MSTLIRASFHRTTAALTLGAITVLAAGQAGAQGLAPGAVYTSTNETVFNRVAVYDRAADGVLTFRAFVATGGQGTGQGLGNQGAVLLSEDERFLMVVNAGSNDVSVFRVQNDGLEIVDVAPAHGKMPVSIAQHDNLVYVVNAGSDDIAGFRLSPQGTLDYIVGSQRKLSAKGSSPAQIGFSPDGDFLYVTEKATNSISRFQITASGKVREVEVLPSAGQTPFGFAFGFRKQLFVSEAVGGAADNSTVTSYNMLGSGTLVPITITAPTTQTAACWVVASNDGRVIFTSNTASDSVSAFSVGLDGQLQLLNAQAATTGDRPLDMTLSNDGRFFYVLNAGAGGIGDYRIEQGGGLASLPGSNSGLPGSASGLAAR